MRVFVKILDLLVFICLGVIFTLTISVILASLSVIGRRRYGRGRINRFSFTIADMISNRHPSMIEDALLNGYISRDHYIYLDFNHGRDRFENIDGRIFFHSVAAHPDKGIYGAGFNKTNMLATELKILWKAFSVISKNSISFIKAHDPHLLGLNGIIMAKIFRLPSVLHMNSNFDMKYKGTGRISSPVFITRPIERFFESLVMNSYDIIMADRRFYLDSGCVPGRSSHKYRAFGVRVDSIHYREPRLRKDMRQALGLAGKKVLMYAGRLHPVKYPGDAIEVLNLIRDRLNDVALIMAGAGPLEASLREMAGKKGLEREIIFLGAKDSGELADLFYTADILIAPHGGVVLVEAALAGTPIVAYDFDWHREFLEDGIMGSIVRFKDVDGMAEACLKIFGDESVRKSLGNHARETALSRCGRAESLKRERDIYEELLNRTLTYV